MAGSNIIEFRIVRRWQDAGKTVKTDERIQFRTKDVVLSVLGVSFGTWSEWEDFDGLDIVDQVV